MRLLLATLLAAVLVCTGCSLGNSDDDGEPAALAKLLATQLSKHSLAHVPLTDATERASFAKQIAALDKEKVSVTAGKLTEHEDSVKATLRWTWDLSGRGSQQHPRLLA